MNRLSKLAELRAKTDRELATLINNAIELGLSATVSLRNFTFAEPSRIRAENAYAEAARLLPKVDDVRERQRLERKLRQLREALNEPRNVRVLSSSA